MMARFGMCGIWLASALFLAGCQVMTLDVTQALSEPLDKVSLTFVGDSDKTMKPKQAEIVHKLFTETLDGYGITVVPPGDGSAVPSLSADVRTYRPGNRFLRWFIGYGAGTGRFDSTVVVRDTGGNQIGACRLHGWIRAGFFGGSWSSLLDNAARNLVLFLKCKKKGRAQPEPEDDTMDDDF